MNKKKAIIIGSCHARPLCATLMRSKSMTRVFTLTAFPAVHIATAAQVKKLHIELSSIDLVITQNITETYRGRIGLGTTTIKKLLNKDCRVIIYPSTYWNGYNPELFILKDDTGKTVTDTFDYHHRLIFNGFVAGKSQKEVCDSIVQSYPYEFATKPEQGLLELETRELDFDIKIASFIKRNFRRQRLFWTFNHPSMIIFHVIGKQILQKLGFPQDLPEPLLDEMLKNTVYPILPYIKEMLNIHFPDEMIFKIKNEVLSPKATVDKYFRFYDANQRLVSCNA